MRRLLLLGVIALTGCIFQEEDDTVPYVPPDLAAPLADLAQPVQPPSDAAPLPDGGTTLGSGRARPADAPALHVQAGGSVTVPDGQYGFTVTANGNGGYRVAWVDAAGVGLRFHGSIFLHGAFSAVSSVGMSYATANGERLDFESKPGAGTLGYVDFVASTDPITVDVLAGAQTGSIWYSDDSGVTRDIEGPATFTSP